ncbi:MAG: ubiquinol-cytochrome c reductase iron-sulfur subunit [Thermoanaerobaculia bacterium]
MNWSRLRRRDFLANLVMGLALIPGFVLAADYFRRFLVPARRGSAEEILLTQLGDLPVGASRSFRSVLGNDLLAVRLGERDVRVFSSVCTHLGCQVGWDSREKNFLCPCHDGRFDTAGKVTAGPPPSPLASFTVRLDQDKVFVTVPVAEA